MGLFPSAQQRQAGLPIEGKTDARKVRAHFQRMRNESCRSVLGRARLLMAAVGVAAPQG